MKLSEFYEQEKVFGEDSEFFEARICYASAKLNALPRPLKVLDYGCGNGFFQKYLDNDIEYFGCDISATLTETEHLKKIVADRIPFPDASFDAVFAGEVIEHLVDTDMFATEIHRVLKPQGRLVLTTPNFSCWYNKAVFVLGYQPFFSELSFKDKRFGRRIPFLQKMEKDATPYGHLRLFTKRGLVDFLAFHNFTVHELKTLPLNPHPAFFALDRFFSLMGMGSSICVVAETVRK